MLAKERLWTSESLPLRAAGPHDDGLAPRSCLLPASRLLRLRHAFACVTGWCFALWGFGSQGQAGIICRTTLTLSSSHSSLPPLPHHSQHCLITATDHFTLRLPSSPTNRAAVVGITTPRNIMARLLVLLLALTSSTTITTTTAFFTPRVSPLFRSLLPQTQQKKTPMPPQAVGPFATVAQPAPVITSAPTSSSSTSSTSTSLQPFGGAQGSGAPIDWWRQW